MNRILRGGVLVMASLWGVGWAGCGPASPGVDPATLALRSRFWLTEEPTGALSIAQAEEQLGQSSEVVLVGRIEAGKMEPWEPGKAAFMISELPESTGHADAPGHDAANCPFCKRRAAAQASTAIIQFQDDQERPCRSTLDGCSPSTRDKPWS